MFFNSYGFIFLFLPVTLLGYIVLANKVDRRISILWLISASLFFYAWWNPAYLGLILASMVFNFSFGLMLTSDRGFVNKKYILMTGVLCNVAVLAYFKYANFFVDNINAIFDIGWNVENIILPLAISFFTFQQIAYLVDAYKSKIKEYNFLQYALFVSFFPQLIAGPIVHHREMMPQFLNFDKRIISYRYIAIGLSIFFLGLFKKVVIADSLSPYVSDAFSVVSSGNLLTIFEAWLGTLAYTFQLYFDFSGYSDMAIGLAFMFGVRLPLNFNSPYKAKSIIEFWQRWHMTLSRFLKDYIYIPLGGNRKGGARRYLNLMITMLLGGLWHGAGWTFIVWGGLHGIYLIINHMWRSLLETLCIVIKENIFTSFFSRMLTFVAVAIAWVYFRSVDIDSANIMIESLLGSGGIVWPEQARDQLGLFSGVLQSLGLRYQYLEYFNGIEHMLLMLSLVLFVWLLPNVNQLFVTESATIDPIEAGTIVWKENRKWAAFIVVIAVCSILKLGHMSEFLYFQF